MPRPVIDRLAELATGTRLPLMHTMMGTLPHRPSWFAAMEQAGVPMFNDAEEMAETAGLLARYAGCRARACDAHARPATLLDRRG